MSPTAKSLKEVMPVACVLVDVRVPGVVANQFGELNLLTIKLFVFAAASVSPATKWKVAM